MTHLEIGEEIDRLERIDQERKRVRRILFKFLRENVDSLPGARDRFRVKYKMRGNWLGDLRDCNLVYYTKQIYRRLNL